MAKGRGGGGMAASSSILSAIKAFAVPFFLFALSIFYQLIVLPSFFPPLRYDVLGIKRFSSIEEVKDAYEKMSSKWYNDNLFEVFVYIFIRIYLSVLSNKRNCLPPHLGTGCFLHSWLIHENKFHLIPVSRWSFLLMVEDIEKVVSNHKIKKWRIIQQAMIKIW